MKILEIVKNLGRREETLKGDALARAFSIYHWWQNQPNRENDGLCGVASLEALTRRPTFSTSDALRFKNARSKIDFQKAKIEYHDRANARNGLCQFNLKHDLDSFTDWPRDVRGLYRVRGLFVADTRVDGEQRISHGFTVVRPMRSELLPQKLEPKQAVVFDTCNPNGPITIIDSTAEVAGYLQAYSATPSEANFYLVVEMEKRPSLFSRLRALVRR